MGAVGDRRAGVGDRKAVGGEAMNVALLRAAELGWQEVAEWRRIVESEPELVSPFFRPEFSQAVAAVRPDVFVAQVEANGERGYFPHQRTRLGFGLPVGGGRSNYQGLVASPRLEIEGAALVRGCGLLTYRFDHVPAVQRAFRPYRTGGAYSPVLDLADGYEVYAAARREAGSAVIGKTERAARKLAARVGPIDFELDSRDHELLRLLMGWKSEQYRRTGEPDKFAVDWNVELLERLHAEQGEEFGAMLSVLRADDRVAALAVCLRGPGAWHWWFPAYDRRLAEWSPGMILLLRVAEAAARAGVPRLDLGTGDAFYKRRLATATVELSAGTIAASPALRAATGFRRHLVAATRRTPFAEPLRQARDRVRVRAGGGGRV